MKDLLIIGSGHNSLTAAFYLAKAGFKPLLLETRSVAGGCVANEEFAPGFSAPLANAIGPLRASVVRDMDLARKVTFLQPDPRLVTLGPDSRALAFSSSVSRTAEAISAFSSKDAASYPEFCATLQRLGTFLSHLLEMTPPDIDAPAAGEMWDLLKIGKRFRALGKKDSFRLLRWGPMAAADLVAEWFETDLLQAAVAARGVFGTAQGPWSAGSGALLLLNAAADPAAGGSSITVKGGHAALAGAMAEAACVAGAEIRTDARVARILVREGRAAGVVLASGEEILANAVVSGADPRRTFLDLVDPVELDPGFLVKARNYRARGTVAKVHLALASLPAFTAVSNPADLHGRIQIAPGIDYLEQAFDASKYGELPRQPYLDLTIPTLADPSLAPAGKHVLSAHVQFVPYQLRGGASWDTTRDKLAAIVLDTLEQHAPGIRATVDAADVLSPVDLERTYG
ncbi:MAG: NAD(P)/FAD-dependent oxidoreductase, partial [Acidobacteria bacterium]|nr:NAD(P)/FAD-dependent oxidoreductase [Acidobacteriota bacterium]